MDFFLRFTVPPHNLNVWGGSDLLSPHNPEGWGGQLPPPPSLWGGGNLEPWSHFVAFKMNFIYQMTLYR